MMFTLLKQNWSWALWPKVSWFLRSRCKLWHVLMYLLQEHSHGWQKIHRYHQHSVQMGNVGKLSVNKTASYTLSYTLPCLPEQLQEPTWPAEGLLPHRLGHMGCTLRWSTWAWGVLGGEHQRKALLPKWQGPSWTQHQQNCRVQRSNSIKSAVFPAVAGAQEHFEYRKGWYKSRSFGLRWWVLWNRPCWFGGHPVVKTPVTYSRAIFMDGLLNW